MSNSDIEQARVSWLADEPSFREFGQLLKSGIEAEIKRLGIKADVSMRTKDIDSLIKKLILKPEHTYESLGDKVGIRAVVRYQREVDEIVGSMPSVCGCSEPDDTRQRLADEKDERVGYISVHLDAWLKDDHSLLAQFPKTKYRAEVQVRTLAQHLWSEISHDTSYKSGTKIRKDLKRRIHLLAGLIEVADNEFSRIDDEMSKMPDMAEFMILKALERQYYKLSARPGNTDLSLEVIRHLWPLYEQTPELWPSQHENNKVQADQSYEVPPRPGIFIFDKDTGNEFFYVVVRSDAKPPTLDQPNSPTRPTEPTEKTSAAAAGKITNFLVRDPFGETTRGVVFDPGKDDVDPYLYFSAAPEDSTKTAKIKFQLHHVD